MPSSMFASSRNWISAADATKSSRYHGDGTWLVDASATPAAIAKKMLEMEIAFADTRDFIRPFAIELKTRKRLAVMGRRLGSTEMATCAFVMMAVAPQ